MLLPPPITSSSRQRRGVILLVVIAMLTLFSVVALAFVFYAQSEGTASKLSREAQTAFRPDVNPEFALAYFLSQFIYDVPDDERGAWSAMRGHSLARTMFGWNPDHPNIHPYSGLGRAPGDNDVNYTWFQGSPLRDPGRDGTRAGPSAPLGTYNAQDCCGYTYADLNTMCLAQVNKDGEILIQSFHRPWTLMGPGGPMHQRVLWPASSWHPQFNPLGADAGGHVKNAEWAKGVLISPPGQPKVYANNDSFWLDIGFPVMTAPDGRKYKMLFAPLVIDLDNKINLNVAGSRPGTSNQGWGPGEINLAKVLPSGTEWQRLLDYRYAGSPTPSWAGSGTASGSSELEPPSWARVDFDARDTSSPPDNNPFPLPGQGSNPPYSAFPYFSARYGNGNVAERTGHWSRFNPLQWSAVNVPIGSPFHRASRRCGLHEMELVLRYGGTNTPAGYSELFRLLPKNLANMQQRLMVTTHSMDLNRPSAAPWLSSGNIPSATYQLSQGGSATFPTGQAAPIVPGSKDGEFGLDSRGATAILGRLDINRFLPPYPAPDANGTITDMAGFRTAQAARQQLAKDLFDRLRWVTTGARPETAFPDPGKDAPEYNALRWLAQLAVNLVDYRDDDHISTPFRWDPSDTTTQAKGYVFGTELPRLVINEVYAQVNNDPADLLPPPGGGPLPPVAKPLRVNFWVELHNPLKNPVRTGDDGTVVLQNAARTIYKLTILDESPVSGPKVKLTDLDNVLGEPPPAAIATEVDDWRGTPPATGAAFLTATTVQVSPSGYDGPNGGNQGFYVAGPTEDFPAKGITPTSKIAALGYAAKNPGNPGQHSILLRRLACPYLDHDPNPNSANYNPYITVDYVEGIQVNDAVQRLGAALPQKIDWTNPPRYAQGRTQPFLANPLKPQIADTDSTKAGVQPYTDQPQHTFFRHNAVEATPPFKNSDQFTQPFEWLVHLDRQLISPMELLHVSAYRPQELTQLFKLVSGHSYGHYAPWFENRARIYRLFEFIETSPRMAGVTGPRRPGLVNINTIWDREVFRALCDANNVCGFTEAEVDQLFDNLIKHRSPTGKPAPTDGNLLVHDEPFQSFATGHAKNGVGLENTLLRHDQNRDLGFVPPPTNKANTPRLFELTPSAVRTHPYRYFELLTKIYNHLTIRSNVFAVWLTVGFFEVTDDTVRPVRLGAEIGYKENRHVRHRMFAIVDRTQLGAVSSTLSSGGNPVKILNAVTAGRNVTVQVSALNGVTPAPGNTFVPTASYSWQIQPGTALIVGRGTPNEEMMVVQAVKQNLTIPPTFTITADFVRNHGSGETLALPGIPLTDPTTNSPVGDLILANPGPQQQFDPRRYPAIVPYFTVIE